MKETEARGRRAAEGTERRERPERGDCATAASRCH